MTQKALEKIENIVLIETLWNVKFTIRVSPPSFAFCFNRNIVECKVQCAFYISVNRNVLIETLWNVKQFLYQKECTVPGFNRNIVECKGIHHAPVTAASSSFNRNIVECKVIAIIII